MPRLVLFLSREIPVLRNIIKEDFCQRKGRTNLSLMRKRGLDPRWGKKNGVNPYGYKNGIRIDVDHNFINRSAVTSRQYS